MWQKKKIYTYIYVGGGNTSIYIDVNSDKRALHRCDAFLPAFLLSQILPFMSMPELFPLILRCSIRC